MTTSFQIPTPDDLHLHVRQGAMLQAVVPHTAAQFGRAVIMPNTAPPITSLKQLREYKQEILDAVPTGLDFQPLMMFYLSDQIDMADLKEGKDSGDLHGVKLYPFGVTTNSEDGFQVLEDAYDHLREMEALGIPLLLHGEDSDPTTDVFDREKVFYQETMPKLMAAFPKLKITCEHITTKIAAEFIKNAPENIGATITPQHLSVDRNAMLGNGINPHLYCKPILKRAEDRYALMDLVMSGHPRVFAGTDSAPHTTANKTNNCGCAGVYSASNAVELYAEAFDIAADLSKSEIQEIFTNFMSRNGAKFYGLPENKGTLTLTQEPSQISDPFPVEGDATVTPWRSGGMMDWTVS